MNASRAPMARDFLLSRDPTAKAVGQNPSATPWRATGRASGTAESESVASANRAKESRSGAHRGSTLSKLRKFP
jgi:hypothetical protein